MATTFIPRIALVAIAGILLTACAEKPIRNTPAPSPATRSSTGTGAPATARQPATPTRPAASSAASRKLPDSTGIAACDDYLASYKGCHRAAHIYAANQLEDRYQAMRTSLLRDSQDPDIRPQLATRCNSLASQLRQALHGKACEAEPASASSSP
jgi:hypothetical protein